MTLTLTCEVGNHNFVLENEDINAYKKFDVEPISICFPHQHQWRLSFRNDRFLHKRKCDLTGADIVAMYPQDASLKVYEREAWFSDKWDPLSYGRPFDPSHNFFEQYRDLQKVVPRIALVNVGSINSDFCNSCVYNKNCYLIFGGDRNEDSMYGALPMFCRNCIDCDWTDHCELCYFCAYCERCYECQYAFNSKGCSNSAFIEDCIGCTECILSFNLKNQSYCIENKQYDKEEYLKRKAELLNGSFMQYQKLWRRFLELRKQRIVKYAHIINGENVSGEIILNTKNSEQCYELIGGEDCRHVWTGFNIEDCFNSDYIGQKSALNFNNLSTDTAYRTMCSYFTVNSSDIEYCEATTNSKNLFGCIGLRHAQYCILNKQYDQTVFEKLRSIIIEQMKLDGIWGRFFPKEFSTFPYNNSTASVFFPRTKEQAIAEGFSWRDEQPQPTDMSYAIPDLISDVKDDILNAVLVCETSGKHYRILPQELAFYRRYSIPIPRRHSDQRYADRLSLRLGYELYNRTCKKCDTALKSPYAPDRPETVYCEKCYLESVY